MANQPNSLAYLVESWLIDIIRAGGVVPEDFSIEHYEETSRADRDRITVQAILGERDPGGCRPWNVAATIERISVAMSEANAEAYDAAVDDALESPETVASQAAFNFLEILDPEAEQKSGVGNTRRRARTFNFLALEAPSIVTFLRPDGESLFFRPDGASQYARAA